MYSTSVPIVIITAFAAQTLTTSAVLTESPDELANIFRQHNDTNLGDRPTFLAQGRAPTGSSPSNVFSVPQRSPNPPPPAMRGPPGYIPSAPIPIPGVSHHVTDKRPPPSPDTPAYYQQPRYLDYRTAIRGRPGQAPVFPQVHLFPLQPNTSTLAEQLRTQPRPINAPTVDINAFLEQLQRGGHQMQQGHRPGTGNTALAMLKQHGPALEALQQQINATRIAGHERGAFVPNALAIRGHHPPPPPPAQEWRAIATPQPNTRRPIGERFEETRARTARETMDRGKPASRASGNIGLKAVGGSHPAEEGGTLHIPSVLPLSVTASPGAFQKRTTARLNERGNLPGTSGHGGQASDPKGKEPALTAKSQEGASHPKVADYEAQAHRDGKARPPHPDLLKLPATLSSPPRGPLAHTSLHNASSGVLTSSTKPLPKLPPIKTGVRKTLMQEPTTQQHGFTGKESGEHKPASASPVKTPNLVAKKPFMTRSSGSSGGSKSEPDLLAPAMSLDEASGHGMSKAKAMRKVASAHFR